MLNPFIPSRKCIPNLQSQTHLKNNLTYPEKTDNNPSHRDFHAVQRPTSMGSATSAIGLKTGEVQGVPWVAAIAKPPKATAMTQCSNCCSIVSPLEILHVFFEDFRLGEIYTIYLISFRVSQERFPLKLADCLNFVAPDWSEATKNRLDLSFLFKQFQLLIPVFEPERTPHLDTSKRQGNPHPKHVQ